MIVGKPQGKIYALLIGLLIGDLDKKFLYFLVEEKEGGGGEVTSTIFCMALVLHTNNRNKGTVSVWEGGGDEADLPFQDFMLCHVKLDVRIPPPPSFATTKNDLHCLQYMRVHVRRWGRLK